MTGSHEAWDQDELDLRGIGLLAALESELDDLIGPLEQAPDWRPGKALLEQAAWVRGRLEALAESWHNRLVVAIVGPSGVGKSTLLNALAGAPISETGLTRPTTREVIAYTSDMTASLPLRAALQGTELRVETSGRARALEYLTLLDTPDTNTLPENQAVLKHVLELADMVLAVFAAQNPRLYDNLAFLRPYVERLPAESIVVVLNKVDRVPPDALEEVLADFQEALRAEWGLQPEHVYLISAKSSAPDARFVPDETPINSLNEYPALETFVHSILDRASQVADRRSARGERLLDLYRERVRASLADRASSRAGAQEALEELGERVKESLQRDTAGSPYGMASLDMQTTLYGLLAQRWWGPVGWLVGLWAALLRIASFVKHPRLAASSILDQATRGDEMAIQSWRSQEIEHLLALAWPAVADQLVAAGFATNVRASSIWRERLDSASAEMPTRLATLYRARLERLARHLAAWPLQLLLNLPTLGMLAWVATDAVLAFAWKQALPVTHLQTGAIAVIAVWLLGYIVLQVLTLASLSRLRRVGAARAMGAVLTHSLVEPWAAQLAALTDLQERLGA
jgi:energy-coupling factor transporter ATP-binding protein EcfA2